MLKHRRSSNEFKSYRLRRKFQPNGRWGGITVKNVTICFTLIGAKESHEMVASRHIDCRVNWGPTMDQGGKILPTPNFFWSVLKTL